MTACHFLQCNGETLTIRQMAERAGCTRVAMKCRLLRLSPEEAMAVGPSQPRENLHTLGGESLTVSQMTERAGCTRVAMVNRLKRMSPEKAVALGRSTPAKGESRTAKPKPAKLKKPPVFERDVPIICNVKPTIIPCGKDHRFTVDKPTPYFSALAIGSYPPSDSWAAKVYG